MLSSRFVNIYGYVAIAAMAVMLLLIVTKVVPQRMVMPMFYAAAALFVVRIALRIIQARQRMTRGGQAKEESKPEGEP
ncbi:MAG TPA: hypothetical protein VL126_09555 [Bacteroidota bacterium]|nr:hypothetical protein [Bacteroidota bacterium]